MIHTRIIKLIRLFIQPPQLCNDYERFFHNRVDNVSTQWMVLRSTRPSATLANVVQEQSKSDKYKDFTYIYTAFQYFTAKV